LVPSRTDALFNIVEPFSSQELVKITCFTPVAMKSFKKCIGRNFPRVWFDSMSKNQPLIIGLLADIQGEFAVVGNALLHGTQLAIEEINAAGGVKGHRMELIHLDPNMEIAR
jgi:ABC-type branched-subunit amino acid transport system substrate-binding protein